MKKLIVLLAVAMIAFSCAKDEQEIELNKKNSSQLNGTNSRSSRLEYSRNSLIVRFADGISESDKQSARGFHEVIDFRLCENCTDNRIELWFFDEGIDIEPKKTTIESDVVNIVNVDYQFDFDVSSVKVEKKSNAVASSNFTPYIKDVNDGITIAVFDTGIIPEIDDANGQVFQNQFLYNAANDGIPGVLSGWDFVNSDNDCFDDNYGVHGTTVTSIITDILDNDTEPIRYQILPLKICNEEGRANYFNFLCATSFALKRAEILHMSIGWYDSNNSSDAVDNIFLDLMSQHPNTFVICSAGNEGNDNDNYDNYHFPSGYPLENIFSIASCNQYAVNPFLVNVSQGQVPNISSFSDYGADTVDYFANGEDLYSLGNLVDGTSFAAPIVTAMIARIKYNYQSNNQGNNQNLNSDQIITILNSVGIQCPSTFNPNKKVKHQRILIP